MVIRFEESYITVAEMKGSVDVCIIVQQGNVSSLSTFTLSSNTGGAASATGLQGIFCISQWLLVYHLISYQI